jgi:cysteine-rich repeat protein
MSTTLRRSLILLVLLGPGAAGATPPILRFREMQQNGVAGVTNMLVANTPTVSPDGKNVYVTADGSWAVVVFARNLATGALTFVESKVHGVGGVDGIAGANGVAVSPDGAHVYVTGGASYAVAVFSRDQNTGALTYVEKQQQGVGGVIGMGGPTYVVVSPDGAHVYVTSNGIPPAVAVFARNPTTGALTFVEAEQDGANGVTGLTTPVQMVMSPDGAHLYVAAWGNNDGAVVSFARNTGTGALTFLAADASPAVPGILGPNGITIDPTGSQVYVASWGNGVVTALARNPTTGALTFQQSVGANAGDKLAMSPDGGRIYMATWVDQLRVLTRDPATGNIAVVQTLTDNVGGVDGLQGSISVTASPDGRSVYGQGLYDNAVSVFDVACDDGVVDAGEECDDGNVAPGDGCDGACRLEAGFECLGAPSWCLPVGARIPVLGKKLLVSTTPSGTKMLFLTKDAAVIKGAGTDPADIDATLHVAFDTVHGEFEMPAGGNWLLNKATVARYVNRTAPTGGAVKISLIRPGLLVKVVGKSLGDTPLDISTPPSGLVSVAHGVVNGGDEHWHCTQFSACTHTVIAGGTGRKLVCRGSSTGDATCAARVPTSTTSTSTTISTTTSTTSTSSTSSSTSSTTTSTSSSTSSTSTSSTSTSTSTTSTTSTIPCTAGTFGSNGAALDGGTGHCYFSFSAPQSWPNAEAACEGIGGYLAVIDSASENTLARSASSISDAPWIGFNDIAVEAGTNAFGFVKVTGGFLTYSGFNAGEPNDGGGNEDCAVFFPGSLTWNDYICAVPQPYICEVEP